MEPLDAFRIPIWRERRFAAERQALLRDPVMTGVGLPAGDGGPVLLIPGFLAGDASLGLMARWLRDLGYKPRRAGIVANVDCTERTIGRLEARVEELAAAHGRPLRIVGQSRGGTLARILAVRRPDVIAGIVCLGSPLLDQLSVHPIVELQIRTTALLGSLGIPGCFSYGCRDGCCAEAHEQAAGAFPDGVAFTSIYSRSDGIVAWQSCLDAAARLVEVESSHCGMGVNAGVFRAIAEALASTPGDAQAGGAMSAAA